VRDATYELLISSSQRLIIAVGGLFVLWLIAVGGKAGEITLRVIPLGLIGGLSFSLAYWLLSRRLRTAQVVWITGFAATASTALVEFRSPEIVFHSH
jgi:predicted membrane-bound mannosyltransferase